MDKVAELEKKGVEFWLGDRQTYSRARGRAQLEFFLSGIESIRMLVDLLETRGIKIENFPNYIGNLRRGLTLDCENPSGVSEVAITAKIKSITSSCRDARREFYKSFLNLHS